MTRKGINCDLIVIVSSVNYCLAHFMVQFEANCFRITRDEARAGGLPALLKAPFIHLNPRCLCQSKENTNREDKIKMIHKVNFQPFEQPFMSNVLFYYCLLLRRKGKRIILGLFCVFFWNFLLFTIRHLLKYKTKAFLPREQRIGHENCPESIKFGLKVIQAPPPTLKHGGLFRVNFSAYPCASSAIPLRTETICWSELIELVAREIEALQQQVESINKRWHEDGRKESDLFYDVVCVGGVIVVVLAVFMCFS